MTGNSTQPTVVRTGRGLMVAGTRISLYDIMGYLKEDWPPKLIRQWLNLTEQQMTDVLDYLTAHHDEVEAEYQLVIEQAEEIRAYWEERNRAIHEDVAALPAPPGREALVARLRARKAELGMK